MQHPLRVLLVDDSAYFLEALHDFLDLQPGIEVVGVANEGHKATAKVLELQPDIVLLDLNLGDETGLALIPVFKEQLPKTKVVILTIMEDESYCIASLKAGADAYVQKKEIRSKLIPVILELM